MNNSSSSIPCVGISRYPFVAYSVIPAVPYEPFLLNKNIQGVNNRRSIGMIFSSSHSNCECACFFFAAQRWRSSSGAKCSGFCCSTFQAKKQHYSVSPQNTIFGQWATYAVPRTFCLHRDWIGNSTQNTRVSSAD